VRPVRRSDQKGAAPGVCLRFDRGKDVPKHPNARLAAEIVPHRGGSDAQAAYLQAFPKKHVSGS
jgi:hypothetical protein